MGGFRIEFLVLLGVVGVSMYGSWFVFGDWMSPGDSYSSVGSKAVRGRLRLLVCVLCVWWVRVLLMVRLVCRRPWCVTWTGGEY